MILRRLIEHVRGQSWTAVALDFLIVVAGVFVGIQVSNWNDSRQDRARETRYLTYIAADLQADVRTYEEIRAAATARLAAVNYILEHALGESPPATLEMSSGASAMGVSSQIPVPDAPPPDARELQGLWRDIIFTRTYDRNQATFDALTSTGDIRVIRDIALAEDIAAYYDELHSLQEFQNRTVRPLRDDAIAYGRDRGLSALGRIDADALVDLARSDPGFVATLDMQRGLGALLLAVVGPLEQHAKAIGTEMAGPD